MTLSFQRRGASQITFLILDKVNEKGETNKYELYKILTSEAQFRHWIEDYMIGE